MRQSVAAGGDVRAVVALVGSGQVVEVVRSSFSWSVCGSAPGRGRSGCGCAVSSAPAPVRRGRARSWRLLGSVGSVVLVVGCGSAIRRGGAVSRASAAPLVVRLVVVRSWAQLLHAFGCFFGYPDRL